MSPAAGSRPGGWKTEDEFPPDELWRTLVGDRNTDGDDPDRWYPMVFQSIVKERGIRYGLETSRLMHESANAMVVELLRRVQAVVWGRKLVRTGTDYINWLTHGEKRHGALGLAPSNARPGDLVCIIFGCSVPLVLRRLDPEKLQVAKMKAEGRKAEKSKARKWEAAKKAASK